VNAFETWWYHEGSGPPNPGEDHEAHCKRMCQVAWSNGEHAALNPTPGVSPKPTSGTPARIDMAHASDDWVLTNQNQAAA